MTEVHRGRRFSYEIGRTRVRFSASISFQREFESFFPFLAKKRKKEREKERNIDRSIDRLEEEKKDRESLDEEKKNEKRNKLDDLI